MADRPATVAQLTTVAGFSRFSAAGNLSGVVGVPILTGMDRLNKYLAHAGVGSRPHCEDLIRTGRVSVDGGPVRELGTKVGTGQKLCLGGEPGHTERVGFR